MFKRIVDVVEVLAAAFAVVIVVLLFVEKAPGTKAPTTVVTVTPASNGGTPTTAAGINGAQVFASSCSGCHGSNGAGGVGPRFAGGAAKKLVPNEQTMIVVVTQGTGAMPAFGNRLSDAEIAAVVSYIRSL